MSRNRLFLIAGALALAATASLLENPHIVEDMRHGYD
jgi:hypothetical protein